MVIFDGVQQAQEREAQLKQRVVAFVEGEGQPKPVIAAVLFGEDAGSQLYTRLKGEAADRVGIGYLVNAFSLLDPIDVVLKKITQLNADSAVDGIIIQKPWRKIWPENATTDYDTWWKTLMGAVDPRKDVDGLHPETIDSIKAGTWFEQGKMLPATCQAVLFALSQAQLQLELSTLGKTIIIGRTDLVGIPLYHVLLQRGVDVELIGTKELAARKESGKLLLDANTIISATGQTNLVSADTISTGVILVDVGEPRPDIDVASMEGKAAFLTPVPGGIGPLTVSFLLENAMILAATCR